MKVFVASLLHESSSFSPVPTNRAAFEDFEYHRPHGGRVDDRCRTLNGYGGFVRAAEAAGHDVFASTYAFAQPSAPAGASAYASLRDEILSDLQGETDVEAIFLFLHGAQMAQGCDDCEGDILARARAIVGPDVFIGCLLDLHANVSEAMAANASVIAACRHYPHTDFDARAAHLVQVAAAVIETGARPVPQLERVPMLGMFYTTEPLMAEANAAAQALENLEGVLSVSLIHGFPWTDVAEVGAAVLVTTEGPQPMLAAAVAALARKFFAARHETAGRRQSIAQVLDAVEAAPSDPEGRPFVIADACDNAGGGAGSDSTFLLEEILARGLTGYAIGLIWDPVAVEFAVSAGVGAHLKLRLGGKTGPFAGRPLDVEARVAAVIEDMHQSGIGFHVPVGTAVALEIAGNTVVACTIRGQIFSPTCFEELGISPSATRVLIVKSSQHFRDQFAPIAREILYCETPGLMTLAFDPNHYTSLRRPMWPFDPVEL